ncbi:MULTISPECIES: GAP family protein [Mycobacterium]|nr:MULTISPECIES: GAP family protein [Mycobacterium]
MWTYVLCLGFGVLIDPARIGIAAILTSRRQALRTLVAYWFGGIIAGVGVGIAVLVLLHDIALGAIQSAMSTINEIRSEVIILSGGRLQITLGLIAMLCLAAMVARERARKTAPALVGPDGEIMASEMGPPRIQTPMSRIAARTQSMLEGGLAWPAFLVGLGASVPPIEGPMALTVIMASGAGTSTQFSAFLVFILLVLVFVEIPLICYLVAPRQTQAAMLRVNTLLRTYRRQIIQGTLALAAIIFMSQGIGHL